MIAETALLLLLSVTSAQSDPEGSRDAVTTLAECRTTLNEIQGTSKSIRLARRGNAFQVVEVHLKGGFDSDVQIEPITKLESLHSLELNIAKLALLDGNDPERWKSMQQLRRLSMTHRCFAAEMLQVVAKLPALEQLDLSTAIQRSGPQKADTHVLAGLPKLKRLNLAWTQLTDDLLNPLRSLTGLEALNLRGNTELTDAAFEHLVHLTNLRELYLPYSTRLTDSGLARLKDLDGLSCLELGGVVVRPSTVEVLKQFPRLETLKCSIDSTLPLVNLSSLLQIRTFELLGSAVDARLPHGIRDLQIRQQALKISQTQFLPDLESLEVKGDLSERRLWSELQSLARFPSLRSLKMTDITDKALLALPVSDLKSLQQLELLTMGPCPRTYGDEGLKHLGDLQQLRVFKSGSRLVTDDGMEILSRFRNLLELDIQVGADVSREGLSHVWSLKQLRVLRLGRISEDTMLTGSVQEVGALDDLMDGVSQLVELEELSIPWPISDRGLFRLSSLKKLRRLDLSGNHELTDEGLGALLQSLPDLQEVKYTMPSN